LLRRATINKWVYSLTPQEEATAAQVGWERQLPMLGQPERNRNYSEGDIWEAWQHMIAAASELAAARMFGLTEFVPHVNTFKNKLDIPGYEIRYSFTKTHPDFPKYALRYKEGVDDPEQIYILIVGGPEQKTRRSATDGYVTPPFRAVGWAYGKDCVQEKYKAPYGVGNYMVPIDGLHEMRTLPEVARV
jgi:hypothetical protein